jgi:outer membrane immunogenic protein
MQNQCIRSTWLNLSLGGALFVVSPMLSSQAKAADIYSPPVSLKDSPAPFAPAALWQGFYLGGHAGGAWGGPDVSDTFVYVGDPSFNGGLNGAGFIGGAQAGYNIQRGRFVFGLEGDLGYLGLSASKSVSFKPDSCTGYYSADHKAYFTYGADMCAINAKYSSSSGLYGDITGRLGYALDRTLFYAKGGVAFLDANFKANYSGQNCLTLGICGRGGPSIFNYDHSDTLVGWTIGAGVEYALSPSWSLKAEYQHFDFGSMSYSYSGCVSVGGTCPATYQTYSNHYTSTLDGQTKVSVTADAVTVGVNYHINGEAASD